MNRIYIIYIHTCTCTIHSNSNKKNTTQSTNNIILYITCAEMLNMKKPTPHTHTCNSLYFTFTILLFDGSGIK